MSDDELRPKLNVLKRENVAESARAREGLTHLGINPDTTTAQDLDAPIRDVMAALEAEGEPTLAAQYRRAYEDWRRAMDQWSAALARGETAVALEDGGAHDRAFDGLEEITRDVCAALDLDSGF